MVAKRMNGACRSSLWSSISLNTSQPAVEKKGVIGILSFEVASLMSKVVRLWQSLNDDTKILELRDEIVNSVAITNLVSLDEDCLITLSFKEMMGELVYAAKSVARLGKRCSDPVYHRLEEFFVNPLNNCVEWCGWEYRWKKMERKVVKMDKFVSLMLQLTQEGEVVSELERTLRRMKANPLSDKWKLYEFRKKLMRQRQELRNIRDMSPWNRSYDYVVRLLARSIFTILDRMTFLLEGKRSGLLCRSHSSSYVHPSDPHPHFNSFLRSKKKGVYELLTESNSKHGVVAALPFTVGSAALTLHYAKIVLQVEKLVAGSPPQLLGDEARDNLYNMLPKAIRDGLRGKLKKKKPCLDVEYCAEGSVRKTLEWLAPIAHNTVKWYSDRSIEQQDGVCGKDVLLVQTFYFADQGKAEAVIIDLLVALNYYLYSVCRRN